MFSKHLADFCKRLFYFFLFSNIYIAFCAVAMCWLSIALLDLRINAVSDFYFFIFTSTICSYNLHWHLTTPQQLGNGPRQQWLAKNRQIHFYLFLLAIPPTLFYLFQLRAYVGWIGMGAVMTFLYTSPKINWPLLQFLKKLAVTKTLLLSFVWTYATVLLPLLIAENGFSNSSFIFILNRFFLIYAICLLFDWRDREADKKEKVHSIITLLSLQQFKYFFNIIILAGIVTGIFLAWCNFSPANFLILSVPYFLTFFLYNYAVKFYDDILFYFILDGLMAISSLLFWLINRYLCH